MFMDSRKLAFIKHLVLAVHTSWYTLQQCWNRARFDHVGLVAMDSFIVYPANTCRCCLWGGVLSQITFAGFREREIVQIGKQSQLWAWKPCQG